LLVGHVSWVDQGEARGEIGQLLRDDRAILNWHGLVTN
jgi:hypothetical protein